MVLINPLGIASWMIALSFMKKLKIYIPLTLTYEIFFMITVILGAFSYFTLIIFITNKMKSLFSPQRHPQDHQDPGLRADHVQPLFPVFRRQDLVFLPAARISVRDASRGARPRHR